jgi:hypothetical protein
VPHARRTKGSSRSDRLSLEWRLGRLEMEFCAWLGQV